MHRHDFDKRLMFGVSLFPCREGRGAETLRSPLVGSRRGFTLFELILVVAVIGVLISVSVPATMAIFSRQKTEDAVNTTLTFFGDIRREAITSGKNWWVRYSNSVPGLIAGLEGEPGTKSATLGEGITLSGETSWMTLDSKQLGDVDLTWVQASWSTEIPFEADGSSGDALITLTAPGNRPVMIELRGVIGRGEVVPYDENRKLSKPELKEAARE